MAVMVAVMVVVAVAVMMFRSSLLLLPLLRMASLAPSSGAASFSHYFLLSLCLFIFSLLFRSEEFVPKPLLLGKFDLLMKDTWMACLSEQGGNYYYNGGDCDKAGL
jgi:hypothetical protein